MKVWGEWGWHVYIFPTPQAPPYSSVLSGKSEVLRQNGHHADSWKPSKQQSLQEGSEKIRVKTSTLVISESHTSHTLQVCV